MTLKKEIKNKVLDDYYKNIETTTIKKIAHKYNLLYNTVYRWVNEPNGRYKTEQTLKKDRERDKKLKQKLLTVNFHIPKNTWELFKRSAYANNTSCVEILNKYIINFMEKKINNIEMYEDKNKVKDMIFTCIYIDKKIKDNFKNYCKEKKLKQTTVIRSFIKDYLKNVKA